jgi:hypothetical protein
LHPLQAAALASSGEIRLSAKNFWPPTHTHSMMVHPLSTHVRSTLSRSNTLVQREAIATRQWHPTRVTRQCRLTPQDGCTATWSSSSQEGVSPRPICTPSLPARDSEWFPRPRCMTRRIQTNWRLSSSQVARGSNGDEEESEDACQHTDRMLSKPPCVSSFGLLPCGCHGSEVFFVGHWLVCWWSV